MHGGEKYGQFRESKSEFPGETILNFLNTINNIGTNLSCQEKY